MKNRNIARVLAIAMLAGTMLVGCGSQKPKEKTAEEQLGDMLQQGYDYLQNEAERYFGR